jgi:hypothetical protein
MIFFMKELVAVCGGYHNGYHGFQGELDQGKPKGTLVPPTGNLPLLPIESLLPFGGPLPFGSLPLPEGPPPPPRRSTPPS